MHSKINGFVVSSFRKEYKTYKFQALAVRLAAKVTGTGWVAFKQLMNLVGLMMDLMGKRFLPRGSLALFDFHTIKAFSTV